jgi:hypothetical protein
MPTSGRVPNCIGQKYNQYDYWIEAYFWGKLAAPENKTMEYPHV